MEPHRYVSSLLVQRMKECATTDNAKSMREAPLKLSLCWFHVGNCMRSPKTRPTRWATSF